jgi:superfamily II DNA or RNA helicase
MPTTINEVDTIRSVDLPELRVSARTASVELTHVKSPAAQRTCTPRIIEATAGLVRALRLETQPDESIVVTSGRRIPIADREAQCHIHTDEFTCENGTLRLGQNSRYLKHPEGTDAQLAESQIVATTWGELRLAAEVRDETGNVITPGLRLPQIGALHALAAHWTIDPIAPALLVLPTGTGKTEVMLASMIMHRPRRLLVLVPSDPLRSQTAEKFIALGILHNSKLVPELCKCPIDGIPRRAPNTAADRLELARANVVVSTVAMLQLLNDEAIEQFVQLFDAVYFDEAHHVPASTWTRVSGRLKNHRVVGFTATPFRLDGERVPGKIIYQFPLRQAQAQGYFREINFLAVDETDVAVADREIAGKAIEQLRADRAAGMQHILLARAHNKIRAQHLYESLYLLLAPDLSPVLIHSGIKQRRAVLKNIRDGAHQIIVCVDMFGEGFDMPALKIAAMHDIHRSLAITLQFTGRFTRTDHRFGSATLIANVGDSKVQEAIEELYAEDADWNRLIPELSAKANMAHTELSEFIDQMQAVGPEHGAFDLGMLRPKTSTVIYRATRFTPNLFRKALRKSSKVHRAWISRERDLCVYITATSLPIDWANVKEVNDEVWDLVVMSYDRDRGLLYIHSSQKSTLHGALARAVTRGRAELIDGEQMFRALSGLSRLVFQNVGLYGRGRLRFRMFTGYDVSEAISPTTQAGAVKSNIFGVGYEDGERRSIGVSYKGRLWSMSSS